MTKRISIMVMSLLLLLSTLLLGACGDGGSDTPETTESGEVAYTVTVKDALGKPYTSGIVVKFMQNGTQVGMQVVNQDGVAQKVMAKGDYTVELQYTDGNASYYYDPTNVSLSADKSELDIVLAHKQDESAQTLFATSVATGSGREYEAFSVFAGSNYVTLATDDRNYFLFIPTQAGLYEFSVSGGSANIAYYGSPHFVQKQHAGDEPVVDNKFQINVKADMIGNNGTGTTVLVIGMDSVDNTTTCMLNIDRVSDPILGIEDEPWSTYQPTVELSPFVLEEGTKLGEFDLTASSDTYHLVYNETDGFYHLNSVDGPLVLVRLTEKSQYLDELSTVIEKSHVCRYFFDENGGFVKKESYNECLQAYVDHADEVTGTYPLTEDLKYIIQQRGDYVGWWEKGTGFYLFRDGAGNPLTDLNTEIAWLFLCCYVTE